MSCLPDESLKRGFEVLEYRVAEAGREGKTPWPPTYAEFIGYCAPSIGSRMYRKNDTTTQIQYDGEGRYLGATEVPKVLALPVDTQKAQAAGDKACASLLNMFDDVPDQKAKAEKSRCLKCGFSMETILTTCERCGEKR